MRIHELKFDAKKKIGLEIVGPLQGRDPIGHIDYCARCMKGTPLTIEDDPTCHPKHANIIDWPTEKDFRLQVNQELALAVKDDEDTELFRY